MIVVAAAFIISIGCAALAMRRSPDWAAGVGFAGTLLLVGFATRYERVRAYERQARTELASARLQPAATHPPGATPPIS